MHMDSGPHDRHQPVATRTCSRCGGTMPQEPAGQSGTGHDSGLCQPCDARMVRERAERQDRLEAFADSVVVTTSPGVNRYRIERQVGHERLSFVTEGGLISEFTAEFYGLLGQRAADTHGQLRSKQHPAIRALMLRAARQGANAVINVELTYEGHTGERTRYILTGTLVLLVPAP